MAAAAAAGGGVRALLRLEGAAVLGVALAAYAQYGLGWGVFALALLLALGVLAATPWAVAGGLIWFAHIGFDRALGYGLKYAAGFGNTHLGRVGRADPW